MSGNRALVTGEWKAVCKHVPGADYDTEPWELYHLTTDWSECADLAGEQPDKLAELVESWWHEADRHGVLPLDDRGFELFGARFRPNSPHPEDRRYIYRAPFPFAGTLHEVEIQLVAKQDPAAEAETSEAEARAAISRQ